MPASLKHSKWTSVALADFLVLAPVAWNVVALVEVQVHSIVCPKCLWHVSFIVVMFHHHIGEALTDLSIISACKVLSKYLLYQLLWLV